MSLVRTPVYVGIEAEGRWRGMPTLFIDTTFEANQQITGDDLLSIAEANECYHLYFGVRSSFRQWDVCIHRPELPSWLSIEGGLMITCEHMLGVAAKLPALVCGSRIRHLFTVQGGMTLPPLTDADINLMALVNSELKIDAPFKTAVWECAPQILDLHYCMDHEAKEVK